MKQLLVPIALTLLVACGREPASETPAAPAARADREADGGSSVLSDVSPLSFNAG